MTDKPAEDGFEYLIPGDTEAAFYKWAVSTGAKDLMLIDRFTGMPVSEFFAQIEDNFDRGRAPILLALMATSIRARNQEWSVERIVRTVQAIDLADVTFVDADSEQGDADVPPPSGGENKPPNAEPSPSPSDESSSSAIQQGQEPSPISAVSLV